MGGEEQDWPLLLHHVLATTAKSKKEWVCVRSVIVARASPKTKTGIKRGGTHNPP
jgi:hypothetical protein